MQSQTFIVFFNSCFCTSDAPAPAGSTQRAAPAHPPCMPSTAWRLSVPPVLLRRAAAAAACRKMLGVWKESSIRWLRELVQELEQRHLDYGFSASTVPVVLWD